MSGDSIRDEERCIVYGARQCTGLHGGCDARQGICALRASGVVEAEEAKALEEQRQREDADAAQQQRAHDTAAHLAKRISALLRRQEATASKPAPRGPRPAPKRVTPVHLRPYGEYLPPGLGKALAAEAQAAVAALEGVVLWDLGEPVDDVALELRTLRAQVALNEEASSQRCLVAFHAGLIAAEALAKRFAADAKRELLEELTKGFVK